MLMGSEIISDSGEITIQVLESFRITVDGAFKRMIHLANQCFQIQFYQSKKRISNCPRSNQH